MPRCLVIFCDLLTAKVPVLGESLSSFPPLAASMHAVVRSRPACPCPKVQVFQEMQDSSPNYQTILIRGKPIERRLSVDLNSHGSRSSTWHWEVAAKSIRKEPRPPSGGDATDRHIALSGLFCLVIREPLLRRSVSSLWLTHTEALRASSFVHRYLRKSAS